MKGRILGFNTAAGTGAISGEDGTRYNFTASDWQGAQPPVVGGGVDFDPKEGQATAIYSVAGGALAGSIDLSGMASSEGVQKVRSLALSTLAFPLAVLLLLATLLPALTSPVSGVSLWGVTGFGKALSANPLLSNDASYATDRLARIDAEEAELRQRLKTQQAEAVERIGQGASRITVEPIPDDLSTIDGPIGEQVKAYQEERQRLKRDISDARWHGILSSLLLARFLVPLGACVLIWLAWTGKPVAKPSLATGGVAIVVALLIYLYRNSLIPEAEEGSIGEAMYRQMDAVLNVGFGTYLIGLIGIGLVLSGMGLIRNPLATKSTQ